jgi:class 3 adenylate cyclase
MTQQAAGDLKAASLALLDKKALEETGQAKIAGVPARILVRALNPGSQFFPGWQVINYSLAGAVEQQDQLRSMLVSFGGGAFIVALLLSLAISHGLTGPIDELVTASRKVESGDFNVEVKIRKNDEIGRLAASFNQMTLGLLQKEKYRSVLDMVADKQIAEELMTGKIELGGEERYVTALFCDIRGFTSFTQSMSPKEVIAMLNEHFTPMTRIIYDHGGVVDKFVGDLMMAIFGAPKTSGDDAKNACLSALQMMKYRDKLNHDTGRVVRMGIGIATGNTVAGRMGSTDRLNYTVLGAKVNLASRLCSKAAPDEILIDEETLKQVQGMNVKIELFGELDLKGFNAPIRVYRLIALEERKLA